jgi:hypothetical protein
VKKLAVLAVFAVALGAAALVASERAHSFDLGDTTSPVGAVTLPAHVSSTAVVVGVTVVDRESGVLDLRLSNDGRTWGPWTAFPNVATGGSIDLPWALAPGPGLKTVVVEVRNGAGQLARLRAVTVLLPSTD